MHKKYEIKVKQSFCILNFKAVFSKTLTAVQRTKSCLNIIVRLNQLKSQLFKTNICAVQNGLLKLFSICVSSIC